MASLAPDRRRRAAGFAAAVLLAAAIGSAQGALDLRVDAPPALEGLAGRIREIDRERLAAALARAGLTVPPVIHVILLPEDDPRARAAPRWVAGAALAPQDIVIFPARVGAYPYGSVEAVFLHEVAHLALARQAGGRPLPRWFHEGVAVSVEREWALDSQVRLFLTMAGEPRLPDLDRLFAAEGGSETARAYLLAALLVADVQRRHGAAVPGAIADRVARGAAFAQAFELETSAHPEEAAALAWEPYRRWTAWIPVATSGSTIWLAILVLACAAFIVALRKRAQRRRQWDEEEI